MDNYNEPILKHAKKDSEPSMALSIIGIIICAGALIVYYYTGYIFTVGICPAVVGITLGAVEGYYSGGEKINKVSMSICIISAVITGIILYGAIIYRFVNTILQTMSTME